MPTDIVFALAVLTLARNAPAGLKALLLTLAIVDDLEHRRRRLRRLERRRRLGPGGRARDLRRVRGPVADRRSGRRRLRGARARVVGGARCRWCRADARRGGRVPHAGRRLPASATRERRGAPGRRSHAGRAGSAGRRRGAVARPRAHVTGGGLALPEPRRSCCRGRATWWSRSSRWPTPVSGCPVTRSRRPRAAVSGSVSLPPGSSASLGIALPCSSRSASGSAPARRGPRGHVVAVGAIVGIPFTVSLFVAEPPCRRGSSSRRR